MRALTVHQPWAWALIYGGKSPENRVQAWSYRGPLAVHAGQQFDDAALSYPAFLASLPLDQEAAIAALDGRHIHGAILGVVDLVDVHVAWQDDGGPCCDSLWAQFSDGPGRPIVHLVTDNPRPLPTPVRARGFQGLWTPSYADIAATVIEGHKFRFADELELHDGLEQVLTAIGLPVERETRLPGGGRVDFRLGGVALEVKVAGSASLVGRQLARYADDVDELLLVTTKPDHAVLAGDIGGKRCRVLVVRSGAW